MFLPTIAWFFPPLLVGAVACTPSNPASGDTAPGPGSDTGTIDGGSDGGSDSGASVGSPGYGTCDSARVGIEGGSVDQAQSLYPRHVRIEPAPGETCKSSVWVDFYTESGGRVGAKLLFGSTEGSIDGATSLFDAAREPVSYEEAVQQVGLVNIDFTQPLFIESLPEVTYALLDGPVTWSELGAGEYRITFERVCWEKAGEPGWTIDCARFADARIELRCDPVEVDAGPVGVSSWVLSSEGDTLCVLP